MAERIHDVYPSGSKLRDVPDELPPLLAEWVKKKSLEDMVEEARPLYKIFEELARLDKCKLCGGIGHWHTTCPLIHRLCGHLDQQHHD